LGYRLEQGQIKKSVRELGKWAIYIEARFKKKTFQLFLTWLSRTLSPTPKSIPPHCY